MIPQTALEIRARLADPRVRRLLVLARARRRRARHVLTRR